jgi:hypothetical protein
MRLGNARRGDGGRRIRTFPSIGHYCFYELDPPDHIMAGYSVECGIRRGGDESSSHTHTPGGLGGELWTSNMCLGQKLIDVEDLR